MPLTDLIVLRRHLHCLRKRGFIDRASNVAVGCVWRFLDITATPRGMVARTMRLVHVVMLA